MFQKPTKGTGTEYLHSKYLLNHEGRKERQEGWGGRREGEGGRKRPVDLEGKSAQDSVASTTSLISVIKILVLK